MKDAIEGYVQRVRDLAEHCAGNEQATKQSLIGPLFTMLGYDLYEERPASRAFTTLPVSVRHEHAHAHAHAHDPAFQPSLAFG